MIIRKLFKFENVHIVRGCSTIRCRSSLHGHSYKIELLFESNFLDNAQMVYDFGLMKQNMKAFIDCFDHAVTIWDQDEADYIVDMKRYSDRWIQLPVSPSAEQFSRVIYIMIDKILKLTETVNGEREVSLNSIIVHETDTGYAQCFNSDAYSKNMGEIKLEDIIFSDAIREDWSSFNLFEDIKAGKKFVNPTSV